MGKDLLADLDTYREDVLLASAAALLHNLGKCADVFVLDELKMLSGRYFFQQIAGLIRLHDAKAGSPLLVDKIKDFGGPNDKTLDVFRPKTRDILARQIINLPPPWNDRSYRAGDLIEYLGVKPWDFLYNKEANSYAIEQLTGFPSYLSNLMNLCHHGASGSEKQDIYYQQQKNASDGTGFWVFLATPFGYEKVDCTDQSYKAAKDALENSIEKFFSGGKASFSLKEFARELQPNLQQVLGDTRRPLNDMTVWDIGHSGMAFLKAGIWSIHQQGSISHDMLNHFNNSSKRYWRVLSYRLDGLEFIQKANSLPELKARRQLLNEELDSLQDFLEEKYPLATEVYRDENGSIFIFPDLDWPAELMLLKSKADAERTLRLEQVYGLKPRLDLTSEAYYNHPDAKGGLYIGSQISMVMASTPVAEPCLDAFLKAQESDTQADLCPHCGVRQICGGAELLEGKPAEQKKYIQRAREMKSCCVCLKLREGRAREWAKEIGGVNSKGIKDINDTIWLNEIADANGRLALVVGRWDLEALYKRMYYPAEVIVYLVRAGARFLAGGEPPDGTKVSIKDGKMNLQWDAVKQVFTGITTDKGDDIKFKTAVIKDVPVAGGKKIQINLDDVAEQGGEMYVHLREDCPDFSLPGITVKVFGQDFEVVNSHTLKTASQEAKDKIYAICCWHNLGFTFFLQSPEYIELKQGVQSESFARRRRVWQIARQFWQEVVQDFRQHYINNGSRPCRLGIRGHLSQPLPSNQAYEILLEGIKLSVVWDGERFITADNLQYLSRPQQLGKDVAWCLRKHAGQPLPVMTSTGYGKSDKRVAEFTVAVENGIKILRDGSEYHPLAEILAEPQTFMALVPAQDALVLVNIIKQKYEREMGKAHQRLPLHVGIVFAHRRIPLRVILDAGKRMLKVKTRCGFWQVQSSTKRNGEEAPDYLKKDPHFASWAEVTLKDHLDDRLATWRVPLKMGDGTSDDEWYPYAILEGTNAGDALLHVGKLQDLLESGNKPGIEFVPATLDFEFLDTGGRRFEIAYDEEGRRRGRLQQRRPYLLQDLEVLENIWNQLSQGLAKNQICTLLDMIEAKREDWDLYENITNSDPAKQKVFLQFCRDVLAWAPWHPGKRPDIALLAEYAVRGLLADAVELYMQILDQE